MWLILSLIASFLLLAFVLFVIALVKTCIEALWEDMHDVFSPTPGSRVPPSQRE